MKKSSYQKLKDENRKLRNQLVTLANFPDTQESEMIRAEWQLKYGLEQQIMFESSFHVPHGLTITNPVSKKRSFFKRLLEPFI